METSIEWLVKAGIHAAFSALGTIYLFGTAPNFYLPITKTSTPLWMLGAASGIVASLASDYIHTFVKNEIPLKQKAQDEASLVIGAAVSAGAFLLALYCVDNRMVGDYGLTSAVAVSVGAELGSSFLINMM